MRFADEDVPSSDEEKSYDGSANANGSISGRENPNFSTSRTTSFSSPHQINHINKSYYGDNNNEYFNGEGCKFLLYFLKLQ